MLLEMRKVTRGAVASIILGLIGLAMVLFLIPRQGIQNPFAQYVAKVSGAEITPAALSRELYLYLRQQRNNGQNLTQEEAVDAGLHMRLLDSIILREALYQYATRNGVNASDSQVAERIREIPAVQGPTHAFDPNAYEQFLSTLHYSRPEFEHDVRGDITTAMLMESLVAGTRAPSSFGAITLAYNSETRVVSIAEAPNSIAGAIPNPTQAQLQTFYNENQEALRLPEFRQLTLVYARRADFASRVNVTDAQIQQEFQSSGASAGTPEKRSSVRIVAHDQAQANAIVARINHGEAPDAVAHALGLQAIHGNNEARSAVTDANVAAAVFSMAPNAPARVVQGQLSPWVVVKTLSMTPGVAAALTPALREQIRQQIATAGASDLVDTAVNAFEEARASGTSVAQAAQQAGLATFSVPAVEEHGRDMRGQPIAALQGQDQLLKTAFQTPEGEASDFQSGANGDDVLVAVDHVIPAHVRPFAEVQTELTQFWIARERGRRMQAAADAVVHAVATGQNFAAAARANHFQMVVNSQAVDRTAAQQRIPAPRLGGEIFSAQKGQVVSDARRDGQTMLVAIVEDIRRVDPATVPQQVEAMRRNAQQALAQSVGEAIEQQIVADAHPQKNTAVIDRMFHGSGQSGADQGDDTGP